ncbi:MAG TPA: XdhC family protein, partial [Gemmatimonadaceae bacterium]|nr:XdhC family protein [Gemmatimonadaceae bacterium]
VGESGRILGSVTIGGCVDARVVAEAEAVLRDGAPRLLSMALGDGDPVAAAYELVAAELEAGRPAAVVSPLAGGGGRLVVRGGGGAALTLGDPALDAAAGARATELLRAGAGSRAEAVSGARLFFEMHAPPLTMVIVGAGHLAMPLARLAKGAGLRTVVVDARERLTTRERFPDADELRVGMASELVESLPLGPSALVVLVAHDYKVELPVLRAVLRRGAAYVGVLGNRRRGAALRELLAEEFAPDALARIHLPAGLDVGARTVPEIALSILAEALAVARGRRGGMLRGRD